MERMLRDKKMILIFVGPAFILFLAVLVGPMIYGLALSFFSWNGIAAPEWYGINNFTYMFTVDTTFRLHLKTHCSLLFSH